jgi:hypothetical protein
VQKLNLRADNLRDFIQLAEGVDKETWEYQLRGHEYSRWVLEALRDHDLADEIRRIEDNTQLDSQQSLMLVKTAIERRYTAAT